MRESAKELLTSAKNAFNSTMTMAGNTAKNIIKNLKDEIKAR